jgi:hypothetical protein
MKKAFLYLFAVLPALVSTAVMTWFPQILIPLEIIKESINNPKLDLAVALSKTDIDNKVLVKLRAAFRKLDPSLKGTSGEDTVNKFAASLKEKPKELRDAVMMKLGSEMLKETAKIRSGLKIRTNQADTLFQLGYSKQKQKTGGGHKGIIEKIISESLIASEPVTGNDSKS